MENDDSIIEIDGVKYLKDSVAYYDNGTLKCSLLAEEIVKPMRFNCKNVKADFLNKDIQCICTRGVWMFYYDNGNIKCMFPNSSKISNVNDAIEMVEENDKISENIHEIQDRIEEINYLIRKKKYDDNTCGLYREYIDKTEKLHLLYDQLDKYHKKVFGNDD